ncbi:MAG: MFS transporter [Collimonas sp.]|uniref:MFS transporter n=1 Tax=Collimonas sp. TaxID=1963772 RepID=UPI00326779F3
MSSYRWLVLAVATISQASAAFVTQGLAVLAGFLQKDLQLSTTEVGLLFTASGVAPILTLLFVGDLLDRRSERTIIGAGTLIIALGLAGAILAPSFAVLLAALFVIGIGYSTVQPGGSRSISKWFRSDQLGIAMGIRQAGLPLGGAAAAGILPLLVGSGSWRTALTFSVAVVLAGGLLFWLVYRSPDLPDGEGKRPVLTVRYLIAMLRQRWMQLVIWSGLAMVGTQFGVVVYLMLFLRDRHGTPLSQGAWLLLLIQVCGGVGRIILSMWSDHCSKSGKRFFPVYVCMAAAMLGLFALMYLPAGMEKFWLIGIVAWLGFFGIGWYGPWVTYIAESAPKESVGLALGAAMTVNQIGIVLSPPLLGLIFDVTRNYNFLWCTLIAWIGVTLLAVRAQRRAPRLEAGSS